MRSFERTEYTEKSMWWRYKTRQKATCLVCSQGAYQDEPIIWLVSAILEDWASAMAYIMEKKYGMDFTRPISASISSPQDDCGVIDKDTSVNFKLKFVRINTSAYELGGKRSDYLPTRSAPSDCLTAKGLTEISDEFRGNALPRYDASKFRCIHTFGVLLLASFGLRGI